MPAGFGGGGGGGGGQPPGGAGFGPTTPTQTNVPAATITLGVLNFNKDGRYNNQFTPAAKDVFADYEIHNIYENDQHRYMAGVSSPGGFQGASAAFFQLAAPTLLWICDWTVAKYNSLPQVPNPFSVGSEWVLLDVHFDTMSIKPAGDGTTPRYRIGGTYFYGCTQPTQSIIDQVYFGKPAWFDSTNLNRLMTVQQLTDGLMNMGQLNQVRKLDKFFVPSGVVAGVTRLG